MLSSMSHSRAKFSGPARRDETDRTRNRHDGATVHPRSAAPFIATPPPDLPGAEGTEVAGGLRRNRLFRPHQACDIKPNLCVIDLGNTQVTDEGVNQLEAALPSLQIVR